MDYAIVYRNEVLRVERGPKDRAIRAFLDSEEGRGLRGKKIRAIAVTLEHQRRLAEIAIRERRSPTVAELRAILRGRG